MLRYLPTPGKKITTAEARDYAEWNILYNAVRDFLREHSRTDVIEVMDDVEHDVYNERLDERERFRDEPDRDEPPHPEDRMESES